MKLKTQSLALSFCYLSVFSTSSQPHTPSLVSLTPLFVVFLEYRFLYHFSFVRFDGVCACSISPQHSCVFHFVTFTKLMITTTYHNRPLKNLHGNRFSCFPLPVYETYLSFIHIQNLRSVHAECLPIHSLTVICISFNIVIIFIFPKIIKVGVKYMQTTVAVVVVAMYALTVFCAYEIAPSSSECVAKYKHRNLLFLFVSNLITIFSPASSFVS